MVVLLRKKLNHSLVATSVVAEIVYQKHVECHAAVLAGNNMEAAEGGIQPDHHGALDIRCTEDWLEPFLDAMR